MDSGNSMKSHQGTRGIPVWGSRLKELRKRRGWTQQELANHSGYSERLVRKAELNGTVCEETLEVLAITLSDKILKISIDDLSMSSRVSATAFKEAILVPTANSLSQLIDHCHPMVSIDCSKVDKRLPLSESFYGHRGLIDWYTIWSLLLASSRVAFQEHALLDNARFGYLHATGEFQIQSAATVGFELDLRIRFTDFLIQKVVCLSSLEELSSFGSEWEERLIAQYLQQIKNIDLAEHAQVPA